MLAHTSDCHGQALENRRAAQRVLGLVFALVAALLGLLVCC